MLTKAAAVNSHIPRRSLQSPTAADYQPERNQLRLLSWGCTARLAQHGCQRSLNLNPQQQ